MKVITVNKQNGFVESIEMRVKKEGKHIKNYYTVYADVADMTFIIKDVIHFETGEVLSTECISWHFGVPDVETFKACLECRSLKGVVSFVKSIWMILIEPSDGLPRSMDVT